MGQQSKIVQFIILVVGFVALAIISQMQEPKITNLETVQKINYETLTVASLKVK